MTTGVHDRHSWCQSLALAVIVLMAGTIVASAAQVQPTDLDQYLLELINRARANPSAEAARFGIDLNEGLPAGTISVAPKQPVAFNFYLNDSARSHSQWMLDNDLFQHEGPEGNHPSNRAADAGYTLIPAWGVGENLAWQGNTVQTPDPYQTTTTLHEGLFVDEPIPDRGHRTNMLNPKFQEIGIGILSGQFEQYNALMITNDFAYRALNAFLTGVIYQDFDGDDFYSPSGEGYDDIAIRAVSTTSGATFETTSFSTGGYTLQLPADTYDITFTGSRLAETTYTNISIADENVKIDLTPQPIWPWSNPANAYDVDANGRLEPLDALTLIDDLNRNGPRILSTLPTAFPSVYFDVDRDFQFTPGDLLSVIDALNREAASSSLQGLSSGGVLSFFESSGVFVVPEPTGAVLALLSLATIMTIARLRGKL